MKYTISKTETPDGELTPHGMEIAHQYAVSWVRGNSRNLELERQCPELEGLFYDIRLDSGLAREHAIRSSSKTPEPKTVILVP